MHGSYGDGVASAMDTLASIAYQFGPFFFAVLFTLVISRTARKWYSQANGADSAEEKKTFRTYFHASWIFGMVLCATSVCWWIRSQWEGHHAFAGTIVALYPNQTLAFASDDQNSWSTVRVHQNAPIDNLRDYWFVVVSDHPVHRGETLQLNYWELSGSGALGQAPPPTATINVPVTDPSRFPQKYSLKKINGTFVAVPFD